MQRREWLFGGLALALAMSSGCEGTMTDIAAGSTIRVIGRAAPATARMADPELAEAAIPSSISTMEGLLLIKTDNELLHVTLARTYASFGFGFMEDHMEQALADDNDARADHY